MSKTIDKSRPHIDPIVPDRRRPSDAFYARLHWSLLGILTFLLVYGFVLARFIPTSRAVGFRMVIFSILCFNALWWGIADRRFARHVTSGSVSLALRLVVAAFCLLLSWPMFFMLIAGRMPLFLGSPTWYAAAVTLWNIGLVACMPIVAGLRLMWIGAIKLAPNRREALNPDRADVRLPSTTARDLARTITATTSADEVQWTRRVLLKTAFATGPMAILVGATGISRVSEANLLVRRLELEAPWLPSRLRGLTLTHISDLHVGRLYRPWMLGRMIDAVNQLDSDLVFVTGDIVDTSNEMLPPAIGALEQLRHRNGIYLSIGNHDMIDSREEFVRYTRARLPLLINERRVIEIGGEKLTIAGLDYASRNATSPSGRRGDADNALDMLTGYDPRSDGPVIALAHHPHAWDVLGPMGVPLTLSGHTHGGQIMFTPPGSASDLGLGQMLFRYLRGFYHRPGETLFVNSGVGNWFPLRVHAPAEVVQIRLV